MVCVTSDKIVTKVKRGIKTSNQGKTYDNKYCQIFREDHRFQRNPFVEKTKLIKNPGKDRLSKESVNIGV